LGGLDRGFYLGKKATANMSETELPQKAPSPEDTEERTKGVKRAQALGRVKSEMKEASQGCGVPRRDIEMNGGIQAGKKGRNAKSVARRCIGDQVLIPKSRGKN